MCHPNDRQQFIETPHLAALVPEENRYREPIVHQMPAGVVIGEIPSGWVILANTLFDQIFRGPMFTVSSRGEYSDYVGFHLNGRPDAPHA